MKTSLFIFLISFSTHLFAQTKCTTPPTDSSEVMIFVDTNASAPEIERVKREACLRKATLKIIPHNYKEIDAAIKAEIAADKIASKCVNNCDQAEANYQKASQKLYDLKTALDVQAETKNLLEAMRKKGQKLSHFAISGHNGGGRFGGEKFSIGRHDLIKIMQDYKDLNEVQSALLLGCYTGVEHEMKEWRKLFPAVTMIGGYDGSAPLSDKIQGHNYITEFFAAERKLQTIKQSQLVDQQLKSSLKSLVQLNAAVYVNPPACKVDLEDYDGFLYTSEGGRKFSPMVNRDCDKKLEKLIPMEAQLAKYISGELEPPTNTQAELRQIYNAYRTNHHCLANQSNFTDPETVFNLLFWHGVKESYANFYESDLKEVAETINSFSQEAATSEIDKQIQFSEDILKKLHADYEVMKANPEDYFNKKQIELEGLEKTFAETQKKFEEVSQRMNNGSQPDEASQSIILAHSLQKSTLEDLKFKISRKDINAELAEAENFIKLSENMKSSQMQSREQIKSINLSNIKIPTKENIKNYTRKDAMETVHQINGILKNMPMGSKASNALSWLKLTMSQHFTYHNNPFSWHEAVAKPEAPTQVFRFEQMQTGGYGGAIGGSMGGSLGSGF